MPPATRSHSNPSIFDKAIAGSSDYSDAIAELGRTGPTDAKSAYECLAIADIRSAADVFRPVYDDSGGDDGYVSLEVSPRRPPRALSGRRQIRGSPASVMTSLIPVRFNATPSRASTVPISSIE
jgi:transaldolase/glucose-6-phosphate isomerase